MFPDGRRQKAYLWYAHYSELKKIQFWQSVVDDVDRLQFRRDPTARLRRLTQELGQIERELGREFLNNVATQESWSGMLPDWMAAQASANGPAAGPVRRTQPAASIVPAKVSAERAASQPPSPEAALPPLVFPQPRAAVQPMAFPQPAGGSQPPSTPQPAGFPNPFGFPQSSAPPVRPRAGRPS
jgi:hypothetical protein